MANTYSQIHIHCVFAVKYRQSLIQPEWKERLHQYITGIVQKNDHKLITINSMPDHVHLFLGLRPHQALSDLMRQIKGDSSEFINQHKLNSQMFRWQQGYGAFSYSRSQFKDVARYIENQEERHRKQSFLEEYTSLLKRFEIELEDRYSFTEPE